MVCWESSSSCSNYHVICVCLLYDCLIVEMFHRKIKGYIYYKFHTSVTRDILHSDKWLKKKHRLRLYFYYFKWAYTSCVSSIPEFFFFPVHWPPTCNQRVHVMPYLCFQSLNCMFMSYWPCAHMNIIADKNLLTWYFYIFFPAISHKIVSSHYNVQL